MPAKITVIMCPVDRPPYVTNISPTLKNMQKIVGGHIETVALTTDAVIVCNEEGLLLDLPLNPALSSLGSSFFGDGFLVGFDGVDDFTDIPSDNGIRKELLGYMKHMYKLAIQKKEACKWHD